MYRGPSYGWQTPRSHVRLAHACGCASHVEKQQRRRNYGRPTIDDITRDPAYAEMRKAWQAYMGALRSGPSYKSATSVADYLDSLPWGAAEKKFLKLYRDAAMKMLAREFESELRSGSLRDVLDPKKVDGRLPAAMFTVDNPYAEKFVRENGARLVREVFEPTRRSIREIVGQGFTDNLTVGQMGRMISGWKDKAGVVHEGVVGLLSRDQQAVFTLYARLVENGVGENEAAASASKYADQLLRARGQTISRTETKFAQEWGKKGAAEEAGRRGLLLADTRKVWITGENDMTCDECAAIDGEAVDVDEDFSVGVPCPPLHPRCACSVVYRTNVAGMTDYVEPGEEG
jgi:hypothetical protein